MTNLLSIIGVAGLLMAGNLPSCASVPKAQNEATSEAVRETVQEAQKSQFSPWLYKRDQKQQEPEWRRRAAIFSTQGAV